MMDIRTYLSQGKPLLFDGAMGTYFAAHPGRAEERCERANLTRPEGLMYLQIWAPRPVTTAAPRQIYTRRRRSGFWNRG